MLTLIAEFIDAKRPMSHEVTTAWLDAKASGLVPAGAKRKHLRLMRARDAQNIGLSCINSGWVLVHEC